MLRRVVIAMRCLNRPFTTWEIEQGFRTEICGLVPISYARNPNAYFTINNSQVIKTNKSFPVARVPFTLLYYLVDLM